LAERSQQQAAGDDLAQIQAKLASARGEFETLARQREQATGQVAAAQQELATLTKRLENRRAKVSEKESAQAAKPPRKPARLAARTKHDA